MEIPLAVDICIICCQEPADSLEHILPAAIGGRLKARILCQRCNNQLGSELVNAVKTDPSIRVAIENLFNELPEHFRENLIYSGMFENGQRVRFKNKNSKLKVISHSDSESHLQDTEDAKKTLKKKLERSGYSDQESDHWLLQFEELEENQPLMLPTGDTFLKKPSFFLQPELDAGMIDDRLLILIAYELLALALGKAIFQPYFENIRESITGRGRSNQITVTRLRSGNIYEAAHMLIIEPLENGVQIRIRLFRWITYEVRFTGMLYNGPDLLYIEELRKPDSLIALSRRDAENGKWLYI